MKTNKEGELPYEIFIQVSEDEIKGLKKGNKLVWLIRGKRKLGYCEVQLELKK